jgi:hypothetical protein
MYVAAGIKYAVTDAVSKRAVMQAKRMAPLPGYLAACANFNKV